MTGTPDQLTTGQDPQGNSSCFRLCFGLCLCFGLGSGCVGSGCACRYAANTGRTWEGLAQVRAGGPVR